MYNIVAYYTKNTLYEKHAQVLKESLEKFNIPHYIHPIDSLGSWQKNTQYKPVFLLEMLDRFPYTDVVYVDCDAVFQSYPVLFDTLDCTIGVHMLDHSKYLHRTKQPELLSGTIFLKNSIASRLLLGKWITECNKYPNMWDQKVLQRVIGCDFYNLPEEYCTIFDYMSSVKNPIIIHYQASRIVRKNKGNLTI